MARRSSLNPGQMFTIQQLPDNWRGYEFYRWPRDVMVVVDAKREVARDDKRRTFCFGDVAPSIEVEVIE